MDDPRSAYRQRALVLGPGDPYRFRPSAEANGVLRHVPFTVVKTILAPLDFSDATPAVVAAARALAAAFEAKLILLNVTAPHMVVTKYGFTERQLPRIADEFSDSALADLKADLIADGFTVETRQLLGRPADRIRDEAIRTGADYVVMGSHGHGALYDLVVGTTTTGLLKDAPCPVVVVPVAIKGELHDVGAEPGVQTCEPPPWLESD
jgi:nucleotide-binding universal stress UspA family protein